MTAIVQPETKSPTRRALLTGALGGLGALAAGAIGRTSPVRGADGGNALLGNANTSTTVTSFQNTDAGEVSLKGHHTGAGMGVYGDSFSGPGVYGDSSTDVGVSAHSQSGNAVYADCQTGSAIYALSNATSESATIGWSVGNSTGVQGTSGNSLPGARAKTGVYGYAEQDIFSSGVYGDSPAGVGVRGHTTTGYAGYFEGRVYTNAFYEMTEVAIPAAPLSNRARLFVRDNGSGKTQLCVRFHTGSVRIISTEP